MRIIVYTRAAPQGSKRHVGNGILVEQSKRVRPYRKSVQRAVESAIQGLQPVEGPVSVRAHFVFQRPKSHKPDSEPITRSTGDLDKLLRATIDGLVDGGAMRDDSQVVYITARKVYSDHDRVYIDIDECRPL